MHNICESIYSDDYIKTIQNTSLQNMAIEDQNMPLQLCLFGTIVILILLFWDNCK
jgi:hypothetical protein